VSALDTSTRTPILPDETLQKYTAKQKLQCKDHTGQIHTARSRKERWGASRV